MSDASLPWPECLGTFDEESCRFFLRELGSKIVQSYPFSVGMEEVLAQIVDEYGFEGAPDAISVLQELLEDDSAANGTGDDGDVWRSWRHSWRHKNDDPRNPYLLRVRGKILPAVTSTRIRLLKSSNFATLQLLRARAPNRQSCRLTLIDELPITSEEEEDSPSPRSKAFAISPAVQEYHDTLINHVKKQQVAANRRSSPASVEKTPLSQRLFRLQENRHSLPSDLGSTDLESTPTHKRINRQARIIDGALFDKRSKKAAITGDGSEGCDLSVKATLVQSPKKRGWQSSLQPSRASWVYNVLTRFQGKQSRNSTEQKPKLRKRQSSLVKCGFGEQQPHVSDMSPTYHQGAARKPNMRHASPFVGFDGACDERSNKPLPLSPWDHSGRPSVQSDVEREFFGDYAPQTDTLPSGPFDLSDLARVKDKDELRSLVSATMSGPQELSPRERNLRHRYSMASSTSVPSTPKTFTTLAGRNPYRDSDEPPVPSVTAPSPLSYQKEAVSSTIWPFRSSPEPVEHTDHIYQNEANHGEVVAPQYTSSPQHTVELPDEAQIRRGRQPETSPVTPTRSRRNGAETTKTPRQRSRSPVKRLIGMVKSMSTNQIPTRPSPSPPKANTSNSANKRRIKELSHKLRHGFLTADLEQLEQEDLMERYTANDYGSSTSRDGLCQSPNTPRTPTTVRNHSNPSTFRVDTPSTAARTLFPVSIKSSGQSKLWAELEYMLIETTNTFLKSELTANRISRDSVIKTKRQWQARNRPQVIEFYYDQATQYELVIANLRTVELYSDYAHDAIMLNSVLHQWKILIRELCVKTLCMPDSIVRRWLHDGRRVLELLGADRIMLANMDKLTTLCLAVMSQGDMQRARGPDSRV